MVTVLSKSRTWRLRQATRHLALALLAGIAFGQTSLGTFDRTPEFVGKDAIAAASERLRNGDFFPADITRIASAGLTSAIPDLKKQFGLSRDESTKGGIASALVKLGDKDNNYWDYLVKQATLAVVSDAPCQAKFDPKGKLVPGLSPEFVAWAQSHNLSMEEAINDATLQLPGTMLFLAASGDKRAIPLLRMGLDSPNPLIQTFGAMGLADFQDKESIPLIISACRRAPSDVAYDLAVRSLVRFDDRLAQSAVEEFIPMKRIEEMRRENRASRTDRSLK